MLGSRPERHGKPFSLQAVAARVGEGRCRRCMLPEMRRGRDPRWTGAPTWATRVPGNVGDITIDLSAISGNTLKLNWHLGAISAAQNGQYVIDYCNAQYAAAFPAEEM